MIVGVVLAHLLVPMKLLIPLVVSGVTLLTVNLMALYLFSPGTIECVSKYRQYERNIFLLEEELQTLRFELKNAWEVLGATHKQRVVQELRQVRETDKVAGKMSKSNHPAITIYMITPTYARWTQKADLTRLCQTLMHVRDLVWVVVEDSVNKTDLVKRFLMKCEVTFVHLNIRTPENLQLERREPAWRKSRGVEQRNLALKWIRENLNIPGRRGVVYFGDDDNTYDLELFDEIRKVQTVTVWPVGICGGLRWEGPVCENGRVVKWHTAWAKKRPFPIDFAGFAISIDLILKFNEATIDPYSRIGWVESDFLSKITNPQEVDAGADNCKKVNVWHTRTEKPKSKDEEKLINLGQPSNPAIET